MIHTFHFPTNLKKIRSVSKDVLGCLASLNLDESLMTDLRLCIEEAVINAMKHGNKNREELEVDIQMITRDQEIEIRICDQGEGFEPEKNADPTAEKNLTRTGGRGVFLIKSLMDGVSFKDNGRCIHMIKKINTNV